MRDFLRRIWTTIRERAKNIFSRERINVTFSKIIRAADKADPWIKFAADMAVDAIPGGLDNAIWEEIQRRYPKFFDGQPMTEDEIKLYKLGIVADILKLLHADLNMSTTDARTAVQLRIEELKSEEAPNAAGTGTN